MMYKILPVTNAMRRLSEHFRCYGY